MNYKKTITELLQLLKNLGYTRADVERELGMKENWVDQTLSRGGNPKAYQRIKTLYDLAVAKSNTTFVVAEPEPTYGTITMSVKDRLAELQDDKKVLKESIQISLTQIQANQAVMMKLLHSVYDSSAEIKAAVTHQPVEQGKKALDRKAMVSSPAEGKHRTKQSHSTYKGK